MAFDWGRILPSGLFKFIVGQDGVPYQLHRALVEHHSKPLNILMNGAMCKSQEGFATLSEVAQQTFARFSEFMYAGNYTPPDPDVFGDQETLGFSINQDGAPAEEPEASTWPGNSQWDEALEPEPLSKIISGELDQKSPRRD
ncbi:MAG: hypothetical protein MMC23_009859, partial [Stictis urceolatum]|nr:hypothetical protein [Stictis urceolata]